MKKSVLFLLIILLNMNLLAQISDIKKHADSNKGGNVISDGSPCFDEDNGLFDFFGSLFIDLILYQHAEVLSDKENYPIAFSLEVMPQVAYSPDNNYVNFLPRARLTWGVFSTDIRANVLLEFLENNTNDIYKSIEWQAFILNFHMGPSAQMRFGAGFFYEEYTNKRYPEFYAAFHLYLKQHATTIVLEGRSTDDADTAQNIFREVNLQGNFRFINTKSVFSYINLGLVYQNYYTSVDLWSIQAGLNFIIH